MIRQDRPQSPFDPDYFEKGGAGSGNFNHEGRPGEVGGSGSGDGQAKITDYNKKSKKIETILSDEEKKHVGYYTDIGYQKINGQLRNDTKLDKNIEKLKTTLEKAIEKSDEQDPPWLVYRGLSMPHGQAANKFTIGSEVQLNGFQSTSLDSKTASFFALSSAEQRTDRETRYRPVLLEISSSRGFPLGKLSRNQKEKEVLLGHGWGYRVIGIEEYSNKAEGGTLVKLEAFRFR